MKSISKKIVTGTIAASLVLGGAGFLYTQANAADSGATGNTQTAPSNAPDKKDFGFKGHGKHEGFGFFGNNLVKETAALLGVEQKAITDELKQGKTLAQIAQEKGLTEDDYLQKLVAAENQSIDSALSSGKITQDQADKKKSVLSDRLKKAIESTKPKDGEHKGGVRGKGQFGPFGKPEAAAQILGITQDELKTELKAGKSLAEIAQAKGISEEDLISKLKDSLTDHLKKYVESKRTPKADKPAAAPAESTNAQ